MIKHCDQGNLRKFISSYRLQSWGSKNRHSSRNLKHYRETLLAVLLRLTLSELPYIAQDYLPGEWQSPTGMPTSQSDLGNPLIQMLSQVTLGYIKLIRTILLKYIFYLLF